jgi:SpoIID/LytB domain protein
VQRGSGYDIVTLPVETYIGRVLAGEALPGSAPAALEALAIAIRTYSTANRGRHRAEGFDLCDQTHCQVMRAATPATDRAAAATAGKILLYQGAPASVFYSASCGGRTERPSNVWPGSDDPPYLPSRPDDGCGGSPEWTTELTLADLRRAFAAAGYRGTLRTIRIAGHNESGRVARLMLDGLTPSDISGQDLRMVVGRTLGSQRIQSAAFELRRSGNGYRFQGHGAGHGVGMCVIGSSKLAAAGESAEDILGRYFPGTVIAIPGARPRTTEVPRTDPQPEVARAVPPPADLPRPEAVRADPPTAHDGAPRPEPAGAAIGGTALSLPESDQGERTAITFLIQRERDEIARALGVKAPPRISVRFHPTTEAYERASRQPWFMLGATINSEVNLLPVTVLRARGLLDRALRHQLVHVMADPVLAGRAAWVREGAAVHFEQGATGSVTRVACPSDDELIRPVSAGALAGAYARARACFERQLAAGKTWQEVR